LKKKYQNIFFFVGVAILVLMVANLDFEEVKEGVSRAGYWFLAVVALWAFLYLFNTAAWWLIINSNQPGQGKNSISFFWLYKITVSGFALNYATPGGLMGGEPYKIMSLSPKIGTERATASVILHTMTHIFSHFWFWLISCVLFVATEPLNLFMGLLLLGVTAFCLTAIWFFMKGYKKGIARSILQIASRIPGIKERGRLFVERHNDQLTNIDHQIAALHNQTPRTFISAVALELVCRIISALEIFFILLVIMPEANYIQCILILAFTSLVANMLFFIPLQLGGREGGFLMSANGLNMTASTGIFVALLVRLRELIWTGIGLMLIKLEKRA
jgi:uncharacterized membrane protein YbhN (UPF0104 family)